MTGFFHSWRTCIPAGVARLNLYASHSVGSCLVVRPHASSATNGTPAAMSSCTDCPFSNLHHRFVKYGPVYRTSLLGYDMYLVADHAFTKEIHKGSVVEFMVRNQAAKCAAVAFALSRQACTLACIWARPCSVEAADCIFPGHAVHGRPLQGLPACCRCLHNCANCGCPLKACLILPARRFLAARSTPSSTIWTTSTTRITT